MRQVIHAAAIAAVLSAAACSTEHADRAPPSITLERTACFGFCPMYKATVTDDDKLVFVGERFVAQEGTHEKALPEGSFNRLTEIALTNDFKAFDTSYPNEEGTNCPQQATDLPGVNIAYDTVDIVHSVRFDQGCFGFAGRDRLEAMIAEMDAVLALDDWIGPREQFMGGAKDGE